MTLKPLLIAAWPKFEIALAVILLALSLVRTGQMAGAMATTSLETDEFGSVLTFAARGPLHVVTDYRAPKNHIFFNLANSVLPGRDSLAPARARMLSILAVMVAAIAVVGYGLYRRRLLEAALALTLLAFSLNTLSLSMEARGYGFLLLAALVAAIGTIEYFRTGQRGWLWAVAASTVLGTYTVPAYVFFAGPLMLLIWLTGRTRVEFFAGLAACAAIALLYAPVATQVPAAFRDVHGIAEADFALVQGVFRTIKLYLLASDDWLTFTLFLSLAIPPIVLAGRRHEPGGNGLAVVMGGVLVALVVFLFLRTPPVRTAAFVMIPLAIAGFFALGELVRRLPIYANAAIFAIASILLIGRVAPDIRSFQFTPAEDWTAAGKVANSTFPDFMKLDFQRHAKYLMHTMVDPESRSAESDETAYQQGRLVVVDAGNKWAEGRRFRGAADDPEFSEITVPGAIRDIVFSFRRPAERGVSEAPAEIIDGDPTTGRFPFSDETMVKISANSDLHSIVLQLERPTPSRVLNVIVTDPATETDYSRQAVWGGDAVIIPVPRVEGSAPALEIKLIAYDPTVRVVEAWAFPTEPAP